MMPQAVTHRTANLPRPRPLQTMIMSTVATHCVALKRRMNANDESKTSGQETGPEAEQEARQMKCNLLALGVLRMPGPNSF